MPRSTVRRKMPWIGVDKFGGDCYGTVRELTEI